MLVRLKRREGLMRHKARAVGAVSGLLLVSALSASTAAASEEQRTHTGGRFYLDLGGKLGGFLGSAEAGDRHQQRIEIQSWSWGAAGAAQHRAIGANQIGMDDTAGKEKSASSFGEWVADVERPQAASGDPDRPVIAGSVPTPPASGQATGKRQHMPIRTGPNYDKPQGEGSVWIRVSTPWSACRVGARYPSLSLGGGAKAYVLEDVTVAGCGAGEVALAYKKVKVRAWDPAKKEE
jgi:hypothetical protein